MKIGKKLILGYLTIALFLELFGFFGINSTKTVQQEFDKVFAQSFPVVYEIERLHNAVDTIIAASSNVNVSSTSFLATPEVQNTVEELFQIQLARKNYAEVQREYQELVQRFFPNEKDFFQKVATKASNVIKNSDNILRLKAQEASQSEIKQQKQSLELAAKQFTGAVDEVISHEYQVLINRKTDINYTLELTSFVFWIVGIMTCWIAFFIGLYLSNSISKPLKKLRAAALKVGKGNLQTRIELSTDDEFGSLAEAFNKMAQDLQQNTAYVMQVCESLVDSLIIIDANSKIESVNQATCDLLGYQKGELIGKSAEILFTNASAPFSKVELEELTTKGCLRDLGKTYVSKCGQNIPVLFSSSVLQTAGQVQAIVCIAKDITVAKQSQMELETRVEERTGELKTAIEQLQSEIGYRVGTEETLRRREAKYRSLITNLKEVFFQKDVSGLWTFLNPAWTEITGYTIAESIGQMSWDYVHPDDRQMHRDKFQELISRQQEYYQGEFRYLTKTGEVRWLEINVRLTVDTEGHMIGTSGTLRDISDRHAALRERKLAETVLKARERYLAALVEVERTLLTFDGSDRCYMEILQTIGPACQASRVYVFENRCSIAGGLLMNQRLEWCAPGISSKIHCEIVDNLSYDDFFPGWADSLTQGEIISGNVSDLPEVERAILQSQGVQSILILPIIAKGEFIGFIGFDNCQAARPWEASEVALLRAAATALAIAHERLLGEMALQQAILEKSQLAAQLETRVQDRTAELQTANIQLQSEIAERQRTENELEKSLSLQRATLESTADGIVVVDSEGNITDFNHKFIEMWRIPDLLIDSGNYRNALKVAVSQLKDPIEYLHTVRQLHDSPNEQIYDVIEFKDGRVFERYSQPQRIGEDIVGRVWSFRDVTSHKLAEEKIRHQALHDLLTDLPNRVLFNEQLSQTLAQARRHNSKLAVCFLDLDRFKIINDTLGHDVGDELLKTVAERLKKCLREVDTIARWGGDEFTLLLPEINDAQAAAKIAQRILEALRPSIDIKEHNLHISSSIGIAVYPSHGEDAETLLKNADVALYRAKAEGRNNYQFYHSDINSEASALLILENSLHRALEQQEFRVYYQPQVDTVTGEITKMEALVRWEHPQLGVIYPSKFIPLAEETGLIVPIGEWVLTTACSQTKAWQQSLLLPSLRIAVNLSARQFQQPNLVKVVQRVLAQTQLAPDCLELEITESIAMQNVDFTRQILSELHSMGVTISIDDFGTGYSSLSYLKQFPLHNLKIDSSFVRDLTTDPNDAAITTAIIALARGLNLAVVAEGVETAEQGNLLQNLQCQFMQGDLFSPPLAAEAATQLLCQSLSQKKPSCPFLAASC